MLESITAVSRNNRNSKRDNPERYAGYFFFFYATGDSLLSEKSEKILLLGWAITGLMN